MPVGRSAVPLESRVGEKLTLGEEEKAGVTVSAKDRVGARGEKVRSSTVKVGAKEGEATLEEEHRGELERETEGDTL